MNTFAIHPIFIVLYCFYYSRTCLGDPYSNQKWLLRKRNLRVLAFKLSLNSKCYFLKQQSGAFLQGKKSGFFAADSEFIAPFPEGLSANAQLLSKGGFAHIFLVFQYKASEVVL